MKRFLGYTRDSHGKFLNRHIQTIANTVHRSTGGGGTMDCYVITIQRHESNPTQGAH